MKNIKDIIKQLIVIKNSNKNARIIFYDKLNQIDSIVESVNNHCFLRSKNRLNADLKYWLSDARIKFVVIEPM